MNRLAHAVTSKKTIYPIFLPHAGCPFQCVYCNQNAVASNSKRCLESDLIERFELELGSLLERVAETGSAGEIAFYGGTFTALGSRELSQILDSVSPWVEKGLFTGIRFSTRPDRMGREVCSMLAGYPITTVELGVQSLCEEVLSRSRRGYSVEQVMEAAASVQERGWQLGIQLMPGLPGDSRAAFFQSVHRTIALQPDFVRLYPTIVLAETILADWYRQGVYRPLSLEEAVDWCAGGYDTLLQADIVVARMGLHADPELERPGTILAGPFHPAFGYLVKVHWWRRAVDDRLAAHPPGEKKSLLLRIPQRFISEILGPRRTNIEYWLEKWRLDEVRIEKESRSTSNRFEALLQSNFLDVQVS
jgi:histone acetyltransferase (RNA polymerase elongator complex component)